MSKVEELRESIIAMAIEPTARAEVTFNLDSLIAAARAEGAEQERERLRSSALTSWCGRSDEYGDMLMMPASLLAPDKESE